MAQSIEFAPPVVEELPEVGALSFAAQSAHSLLHNLPDRVGVIYRPTYEENARTPETNPLNVEEQVLSDCMDVIRERRISPTLSRRPYWDRSRRYDPIAIFGGTIQSVDLHDAPLPEGVFPPEEDVAAFIEVVKQEPGKVGIGQQLDILLDITGNDLMGAVNLGWIATRFMGRGADQRAYPNIHMDEVELKDWNTQLKQFETYNDSGKNDAPGDTYYFWTHVFGAMVFSERNVRAKLAQFAFGHGTEIMAFVRRTISFDHKQPNITDHDPASDMGRELGHAFANLEDAGYVYKNRPRVAEPGNTEL